MCKRVESMKTAVFVLGPDGCSIHTFEITKELTKYEYHEIKNTLYRSQEGKKKVHTYQVYKGYHYCKEHKENGVRIYLEHNKSKLGFDTYFVRMAINPRKLIEPECSYLGILPPEESSIKNIKTAFKKLFKETVFDNDITSYYLSRVDLCTNIHCDTKHLFRELVRVLRKLPTPPKYERKFYKDKNKKKANRYNKHYLRFCCDTKELVIYDKTYQGKEENLEIAYDKYVKGILRFEVRCERPYIRQIEKDSSTSDVLETLWLLIQESEDRIIRHFGRCFSDANFMQMDELKRRIAKSGYRKKNRDAMKELVDQLQRVQSVDKALDNMKKAGFNTDGILDRFAKLGISPIPLRKKFCAQCLPGPVELLRRVSDGAVTVEYLKVKYR